MRDHSNIAATQAAIAETAQRAAAIAQSQTNDAQMRNNLVGAITRDDAIRPNPRSTSSNAPPMTPINGPSPRNPDIQPPNPQDADSSGPEQRFNDFDLSRKVTQFLKTEGSANIKLFANDYNNMRATATKLMLLNMKQHSLGTITFDTNTHQSRSFLSKSKPIKPLLQACNTFNRAVKTALDNNDPEAVLTALNTLSETDSKLASTLVGSRTTLDIKQLESDNPKFADIILAQFQPGTVIKAHELKLIRKSVDNNKTEHTEYTNAKESLNVAEASLKSLKENNKPISKKLQTSFNKLKKRVKRIEHLNNSYAVQLSKKIENHNQNNDEIIQQTISNKEKQQIKQLEEHHKKFFEEDLTAFNNLLEQANAVEETVENEQQDLEGLEENPQADPEAQQDTSDTASQDQSSGYISFRDIGRDDITHEDQPPKNNSFCEIVRNMFSQSRSGPTEQRNLRIDELQSPENDNQPNGPPPPGSS